MPPCTDDQLRDAFAGIVRQFDAMLEQLRGEGLTVKSPRCQVSDSSDSASEAGSSRAERELGGEANPGVEPVSPTLMPTPTPSRVRFETPSGIPRTFEFISVSNVERSAANATRKQSEVPTTIQRAPSKRVQCLQSQADVGYINDDLRAMGVPSKENIDNIDHLRYTPIMTPARVKHKDHDSGVHSAAEFEDCLDLDQPKVPVMDGKDNAHGRELRVPGEREPWSAYQTTPQLQAAHNDFYERSVAQGINSLERVPNNSHGSTDGSGREILTRSDVPIKPLSRQRGGANHRLDSPSTTPLGRDDEIEQSSWKQREMFSRPTKNRREYLREHASRTAAINNEPRGLQLPDVLRQHEARDFLLEHGAYTGRRIAVDYETMYTPGLAASQVKMGNLLDKLRGYEGLSPDDDAPTEPDRRRGLHQNLQKMRDDFNEITPTLPQRVRPVPRGEELRAKRELLGEGPLDARNCTTMDQFEEVKVREETDRLVAERQAIREGEEVSTLVFNTPDETERYFDLPNVCIGVYDKDEGDYWHGKELKQELKDNRKRGGIGAEENDVLLQQHGVDEAQLDQHIDQAREALVKSGKMLPPTPPTASPTPSSKKSTTNATPTSSQRSQTPSSKKSASTVTPSTSSRKRKAPDQQAEPVAATTPEDCRHKRSGPDEGCDGFANGCSCRICESNQTPTKTRSGREHKKPRRLDD